MKFEKLCNLGRGRIYINFFLRFGVGVPLPHPLGGMV